MATEYTLQQRWEHFCTSWDEPVIGPKIIVLLCLVFLIAGYSIEGIFANNYYRPAFSHPVLYARPHDRVHAHVRSFQERRHRSVSIGRAGSMTDF